MGHIWKDEDITKALRKAAHAGPAEAYDRVWFKIEDKLASRGSRAWSHLTWKPWGHPVRWVALAACLCVSVSGVFYHKNSVEQSEIASYVITVADPTANVSQDAGMMRVSTLLSEPSSNDTDMKIDDNIDPIAVDEVLL
jgi:hypothetical protein